VSSRWDEEDEEDEDEFGPGSADYDLSEEHGYLWEPRRDQPLPAWVIVGVTCLALAALILPAILLIYRYG
jgi:hypothetical protein